MQMKKIIGILLALCFLMSVTAVAASARPGDHDAGHRGVHDEYRGGHDEYRGAYDWGWGWDTGHHHHGHWHNNWDLDSGHYIKIWVIDY
jgi:Spy/CpxP family protein refolding chaperone